MYLLFWTLIQSNNCVYIIKTLTHSNYYPNNNKSSRKQAIENNFKLINSKVS